MKKGLILTAIVGALGLALAVATFGGILYLQISKDLPAIASIDDYHPPQVTQVYAKDGLMGLFFKENREVLSYDRMPKKFIDAFLSAEDDEFFQHGGVNIRSLLRAAVANFLAGQVIQGGSTITQQLAKSLYLTPDRNLIRKAKEMILAYRLEKHLTKEQILYIYLNQIYLGNGAYGIQAASQAYFRKDAASLSLGEMALLAGVPKAPSKYNPLINPKRAKERQLYVLRRMAENKFITQEESTNEGTKPLKIYFPIEIANPSASYYLEHVRRLLIQKYGEKAVYEDGLIVQTAASLKSLEIAQNALLDGLSIVEKRNGFEGPLLKIEKTADRAAFLVAEQEKLEKKRTPYSILTAGGEITTEGVFKDAGLTKPEKFLKVGEVYEALVEAAPNGQKNIEAKIGKAAIRIPWSELAWTKTKSTALLVSPGDVIRVRILRIKDKEGVEAALEKKNVVQGAILTMDSRTGHVLSLIGGTDYTKSEFNRAIQAKRQAGSLLKPLLYSLAIERGYTPASILVDSPLVFDNEESGTWKPSNYEERFFGDTTLWQALVNSRNVPTVKLVQAVGVDRAVSFLRRLHLTGDIPNDLSVSLGSAALNLEELIRAYALFPRNGSYINMTYILSVHDRKGNSMDMPADVNTTTGPAIPTQAIVAVATPASSPAPEIPTSASNAPPALFLPDPSDPHRLMDPRVASLMTILLHDVVQFGTARNVRDMGRWIAGKTGTTNDFRDAWFIGFTPSLVSGVWVGHDDLKPLGSGEAGSAVALPIWAQNMRELLAGAPQEDYVPDPGIVFVNVHPKTGEIVESRSSRGVLMPFIAGTEPSVDRPSARGKEQQSGADFLKEDLGE